jgi:hypothetical protein
MRESLAKLRFKGRAIVINPFEIFTVHGQAAEQI